MKKKNYIVKKTVRNEGRPDLTKVFDEIVTDALDSLHTINNLDDIYDDVSCLTEDMIEHTCTEHPEYKVVNFKVVANENNNPNVHKFPYFMDIYYRHKDSVVPTVMSYKFDIAPAETVEDKFAYWR